MITNLRHFLIDVSKYDSRTDQVKARLLYVGIFSLLFLIVALGTLATISGGLGTNTIPLIIAVSVVLFAYGTLRSGRLNIASWLLLIMLVALMNGNALRSGEFGHLQVANGILFIMLGGFLLETPGILVLTAIAIIILLISPDITGLVDDGSYGLTTRLPLVFVDIFVALTVYNYNRYNQISRLTGRDLESVERLKLTEINMQITRQASTRESMDNALNSTLKLILESYPSMYHAQVFLIDSDGIQARLVASTGEAGKQLLERKHSLAVGSLSVIGQCTLSGEMVISRPNDKEGVHRANELLPLTTLEVAFPLQTEGRIIGALDLQSKELEALGDSDRLTFQSLTNSLSLAIDNIRQFEEAKTRIDENQRLAEQTRVAFREVERLNQRLIGRAWSEYIKGQGEDQGLEVDFMDDSVTPLTGWTISLAEAVQSQNMVQVDNIIAVPLRVRGQVVGAMEFELDTDQDFTPEDLELITEVSERFGLAAENTRLVEESQRNAQRATLVNQITSRFQSSQNVEATLAEAARSLSDTLGVGQVMIRLGLPEKPTSRKEG